MGDPLVCDDKIDLADYVVWVREFLNKAPVDGTTVWKADFNRSGSEDNEPAVTLADYVNWVRGMLANLN
jgi:hypothetical protein